MGTIEPGVWWGGRATVAAAFSFFIGMMIDAPWISTTVVMATDAVAAYLVGIDATWTMVVSVIAVMVGNARFGIQIDDETTPDTVWINKGSNKVNSQLITVALFVLLDTYAMRVAHRTTIHGHPSGLMESIGLFSLFALLSYGSEALGRKRCDLPLLASVGSAGILFFGYGMAYISPHTPMRDAFHVMGCLLIACITVIFSRWLFGECIQKMTEIKGNTRHDAFLTLSQITYSHIPP